LLSNKGSLVTQISITKSHYIESVHKPVAFKEVVIPAKAGIQFFQEVLDAESSPA
jgi:hypothetical protein